MKTVWMRLGAQYLARARRERALLLGAVLTLIAMAGFVLSIEPPLKRARLMRSQLAQQQTELAQLIPQVQSLTQRQREPPPRPRPGPLTPCPAELITKKAGRSVMSSTARAA